MSVQLPDLPSFCSAFELHTNRRCRIVSQASEEWLTKNGIGYAARPDIGGQDVMTWKKMKIGLFAALCYPRADATQFKLVVDLLSLLVWNKERLQGFDLPHADADVLTLEGELFIEISDRLARIGKSYPVWYARFQRSKRSFCEAQIRFMQHRNTVPDLESYIEWRRNASGEKMVIDLIEYADGLNISDNAFNDPVLRKLVEITGNIVLWSEDIASFDSDQAKGITHNLVVILMNEKDMNAQAALNYAGTLVQQSINAFVATEHELQLSSEFLADIDMQAFVRGLRDHIVGSINWLYETEKYFGDKGDQVRIFRWIFLDAKEDQ